MKYNINKGDVTALLAANDLMELLTVIPVSEIENKGIPFMRSTFNEKQEDREKFNAFWTYFTKNWLIRYPPEDWNVCGKDDKKKAIMVNRTNNSLERYNGTLQGRFKQSHPGVEYFVREMRQLSMLQVDTYSHLSNNREK